MATEYIHSSSLGAAGDSLQSLVEQVVVENGAFAT